MITTKQTYEWVKTGYWNMSQFNAWINENFTVKTK
jgi:hypothetical protein